MIHVWNNAQTTLNGSIDNSQLSMTVSDGSLFWDGSNESTKPSTENPSFFTLITYNIMSGTESTDSQSGRLKVEIVAVTGISGNVITIAERGTRETTAQSFATGAYVYKFVDKEDTLALIKFIRLSLMGNNQFNF